MSRSSIAIVVCAWPPQGGGIGNNAYYHAQQLSALGWDVAAFAPAKKHASTASAADDSDFKPRYLKNWFGFGHAGFLFGLWRELKRFDIIHLYHPFFGTDLIVGLFKLFHREKKLILHYEMDPVGLGWQKVFFAVYLKIVLGWLIGLSDKVIALSWDHAEHCYLTKYLMRQREKFVAIPNGIDTHFFRPMGRDEALMKTLGIAPGDKVIIFVGGLDIQHYFKGVEVLLKSLASLEKACKVLIVGDGGMKGDYQQMARDLGVSDRVIFAGWVKNEKLPAYYGLADVFVLPSTARTESFGIVIAEAQACGIPAIVSDWPGCRQTIEDPETGYLVRPGDEGDLTDKIGKVLADNELRNAMREKAVKRAKELYDWSNVIVQITDVYQSLGDAKSGS